jgi:hypothetical protein
LSMLAMIAQAKSIDRQAELDRCRVLREQMAPMLRAGQGLSAIVGYRKEARRCARIERRPQRGDGAY